MGTYMIPRNTKGEGRILFIFSTKALIFTVVGARNRLTFLLAMQSNWYAIYWICYHRNIRFNRIYMWNL